MRNVKRPNTLGADAKAARATCDHADAPQFPVGGGGGGGDAGRGGTWPLSVQRAISAAGSAIDFMMVEAAGVEPASENARNEETTCVAGSKFSGAASEPARAAAS
jgi:hypothetical protein